MGNRNVGRYQGVAPSIGGLRVISRCRQVSESRLAMVFAASIIIYLFILYKMFICLNLEQRLPVQRDKVTRKESQTGTWYKELRFFKKGSIWKDKAKPQEFCWKKKKHFRMWLNTKRTMGVSIFAYTVRSLFIFIIAMKIHSGTQVWYSPGLQRIYLLQVITERPFCSVIKRLIHVRDLSFPVLPQMLVRHELVLCRHL